MFIRHDLPVGVRQDGLEQLGGRELPDSRKFVTQENGQLDEALRQGTLVRGLKESTHLNIRTLVKIRSTEHLLELNY